MHRRLIIRPGAIGDLIVSLPALEHLLAGYTEVWVAEQNVPLVRFADRVRSLGSTSLDLLELGRGPDSLRETLAGFDSIVSWYGTSRPEFRNAVRDLPVQFHPALPEGSEGHAVEFYCAQVGAAVSCPRIPVPGPAPRRELVIHPFSGSARKNWPLDRFRAVAAALADEVSVAWTAGPEEDLPEARRFNSLYDLASWLAGAAVFLGNDSGIAHLAAAVGVPAVCLFGPTDPRVWAPKGNQVLVLQGRTLTEIPMETVVHCVRCELLR